MRYAIVYSSHTGNTAMLAQAIREVLPPEDCIYFGAPDKKEFQKIVSVLADRYGVKLSEEELLAEANKWELSHGGLSGRTAQQFIDYLLGKQ